MIKIQINDGNYSWMTISQLQDNDMDVVPYFMRDVKRNNPDKRVRAINNKGSLIDMID